MANEPNKDYQGEDTSRVNDISPIKGRSRFYDAMIRVLRDYPKDEHPSAALMLDLFWSVQDEFDKMVVEAQSSVNIANYIQTGDKE